MPRAQNHQSRIEQWQRTSGTSKGGAIYGLYSTSAETIRYVGQTSKTAGLRLKEHLSRARAGAGNGCTAAWAWIRAELEAGHEIRVCVLEECEIRVDLNRAERAWIARLRRLQLGADLNVAPGGYGTPLSTERNSRIAASMQAAWGRPEARQAMREAVRASWATEERRAAHRAALARPETQQRLANASQVALHTRWHVNRGVSNPLCALCSDETDV